MVTTRSVDQQTGEREVPEVVGADLHLESVDGAAERDGHDARVVDQHVDLLDAVREGAHRPEVGQVALANLGVRTDVLRDRLALRGVPAGEHHPRTRGRELASHHRAEPAVRPRHDEGAAVLFTDVCCRPFAHASTLLRPAGEAATS